MWRENGDGAVGVCDKNSETNQREHVWAAEFDGVDGALEEWPAAPPHDRSRKRKLQPGDYAWLECMRQGGEHVRHSEDEERNSEEKSNLEAPGHVDKLRIHFGDGRDGTWLERHSTL